MPDIREISSGEHPMLLVKPFSDSFAVLGIDRKGFVCYRCTVGKHSCKHVNAVKTYLEQDEENIPDFLNEMCAAKDALKQRAFNSWLLKSVSHERISWHTSPRQQRIYKLSSSAQVVELDDGTMPLIPTDEDCPECNGSMSVVVKKENSRRRLLLSAHIMQVTGKHTSFG